MTSAAEKSALTLRAHSSSKATRVQQAGIARADVVVADTGDDEDNLGNKLIFESLDLEDPVTVISSTKSSFTSSTNT